MDFVSCLYYRKIMNCIVLVVISSSSSSSAATAVKCLFCVSTANCCCIGRWRYVSNASTGNSETKIE